MSLALDCCGDHGGTWERRGVSGSTSSSSDPSQPGPADGATVQNAIGSWREAFLRAPYLRDTFVAMGVLSETFETAITWERFPSFHESVCAVGEDALAQAAGKRNRAGLLTTRFTHVYPDGPAVYFTVIAQARRGEEA